MDKQAFTEREKVLYDVAKAVFAHRSTEYYDSDELARGAREAWDAAEHFYEEMAERMSAKGGS